MSFDPGPRALQIRDIYDLLKIALPENGDTVLFTTLEEFQEYHTNQGYEQGRAEGFNQGYDQASYDNDWHNSSC